MTMDVSGLHHLACNFGIRHTLRRTNQDRDHIVTELDGACYNLLTECIAWHVSSAKAENLEITLAAPRATHCYKSSKNLLWPSAGTKILNSVFFVGILRTGFTGWDKNSIVRQNNEEIMKS